jgi:CheY-like chemotaxis protein
MSHPEQLILNVDDTDAARYARTRILTKAGLRVVEAASGTEAMALARVEAGPDPAGREAARHPWHGSLRAAQG